MLALNEDGDDMGDIEGYTSEIEAIELHVDEDPQIQLTDLTAPTEGTPNQQEGEGAEGTNDKHGMEWIAIPEWEGNDNLI